MKKLELEPISGSMFDNFKKEEIGNLGEIIGGRASKSKTTGWFSCDTGRGRNKVESGGYFTSRREARRSCK